MKTIAFIVLACAAAAKADTATVIERSQQITPPGATDLVPRDHGSPGESLKINEPSIRMNDETVVIMPEFSPPFDFPSIYISKDRNSGK